MADSLDKFTYVMLVNQPDFIPLHQELQRGKTFQIIYADANSSLYKRITGEKSPPNVDSFFHNYSYYPSYPLSRIINKILNPFYKNIEEREYEFDDNKQYYLEEFMQ